MAKTRRGESKSVNDRLPPEIWYQILTKLPAKSILRCRSVCKTWYSLISSPDFISDHSAETLDHSTTNRVLVHQHDVDTLLCELSSHDESFVEEEYAEHGGITERFSTGHVHIVGSCNGLVCLVKVDEHTVTEAGDTEVHSFLIWNPSIRKLVQLRFRPSRPDASYLLGFGFDSESCDYKVLRSGYLMSHGSQTFGVPVVSEIFDLRKGVWRAISPPTIPRYRYVEDPEQPDSCVYLHGSLHWIGYEDQFNYVIVSFNLSNEVYQEMGMPGDAEFKDVEYSDLHSVLANNGLLSVALLRNPLQGDVVGQACCSVWSMKKYGVAESWTKLFNIELPYERYELRLFRFWENGVVFVLVWQEGFSHLVVYNPENRTSEVLFSVDEVDRFICNVCFYKESLVLP